MLRRHLVIIHYRLCVLLVCCLVFWQPASAQTAVQSHQRRVAAERARDIRLPATDNHYRIVKDYIEDVPDSDYFHASPAAYEAFRDMKYGVRIHWGIYTIWQMPHESWDFLTLSDSQKQAYQQSYKTWNPTGFNADQWMDLFQQAGMKCFAITTKHHEGFSLFDTKTRVRERVNYLAPGGPAIEDCNLAYSIMETPFHRDVIKELCTSARRHGIKIDLYFSHPDWYDADFRPYNYHPLQTPDAKLHPTNYGDSNSYRDAFAHGRHPVMAPDVTPEERERMILRHRQQLRELMTNYGKIDMVCLDQWLGPTVWPELKKTIKMMRALQPDVMLRARGIGNYGDYYTPEGFVPGDKANTNMPWMVIYPLAKGFSYDKVDSDYKGSKWIIDHLVDAVAKGGAFMVGIGPDSNGHFHPKAVQQLLEAGRWLKINGEGIYATRARKVWKEDPDIRYTTTKDKLFTYAFALSWPGETLTLATVRPVPGTSIRLLGYPAPLKWDYANGRLTIHVPAALQEENARPCRYAWAFRIREEPG